MLKNPEKRIVNRISDGISILLTVLPIMCNPSQYSQFQSLLKKTLQKHHRTVAEALEQSFPETRETQPEILGHHFNEAGISEKAIDYFQRAGKIAIRRSANFEAISNLTKSLEILETLPESQDRHR